MGVLCSFGQSELQWDSIRDSETQHTAERHRGWAQTAKDYPCRSDLDGTRALSLDTGLNKWSNGSIHGAREFLTVSCFEKSVKILVAIQSFCALLAFAALWAAFWQ